MILVLLIGLGLIVGSFTNVLVWRLHEDKGWVSGRSECIFCHHVLAPHDLIPVLSWLYLRGRCRYCKAKIEDTPLTELALPILFVGSYLAWPYSFHSAGLFQFVCWLLFMVVFLALAVYDLRWFILPDRIVFPLVGSVLLEAVTLVFFYHYGIGMLLNSLLGAAVLSGLFYILFMVSDGRWIGGGDVKLALALGLLAGNGIQALLLLFVASTVGTVCMIPALISRKIRAQTQIPFGPFLIFGLIVVYLFGTRIIAWYSHSLIM